MSLKGLKIQFRGEKMNLTSSRDAVVAALLGATSQSDATWLTEEAGGAFCLITGQKDQQLVMVQFPTHNENIQQDANHRGHTRLIVDYRHQFVRETWF